MCHDHRFHLELMDEANERVSQVEILQLENNLSQARQRLGEMRKIRYQDD